MDAGSIPHQSLLDRAGIAPALSLSLGLPIQPRLAVTLGEHSVDWRGEVFVSATLGYLSAICSTVGRCHGDGPP
jgi:hypothetical protein